MKTIFKYEIFTFNSEKHSKTITLLSNFLLSHSLSPNTYDYLFLIGGDGTTIKKLKTLQEKEIKIISLNAGTNTFLGEDLNKALIEKEITNPNNFFTYQLLKLEHGESKLYGINEIFITGDLFLEADIYINNELFQKIRSFGILFSTKLGCTAFNKSTLGPIIWPSLNAYLLTPIFLQNTKKINSLQNSIVLSEEEKIEIKVLSKNFYIYIDNEKYKFNEANANFYISIIKSKARFFWPKKNNHYIKKLKNHFVQNTINS